MKNVKWNGIVSWKVDQGYCCFHRNYQFWMEEKNQHILISYCVIITHNLQNKPIRLLWLYLTREEANSPPSRGRNEMLIQVCQIPKFGVFYFDHIAFQPKAINNRLKMLIHLFAQTFFMSSLEFNFKNTFTVCTLLT